MPITVTVRTVSGASGTVDVESTITIGELKKIISEQCGLGFASTLVYKGAPLKKDDVTLDSLGYQATESIVGVFKKTAPVTTSSTPSITTTATATTSTETTKPDVPSTPAPASKPTTNPALPAAAPPQSKLPPAVVKPPAVEWDCQVCTYINIPARTVCEMCGTADPSRSLSSTANTAASSSAMNDVVVPTELIEQRLKQMGGDNMAEDTKDAVRAMIEGDLREELASNGGQPLSPSGMSDAMEIDLEDLLDQAATDDEQRKSLAKEFNLAEDASIDDIRQAIVASAQEQQEGDLDQAQILQQLLQDPAMAAQLQDLLNEHKDDPEALQQALLGLLTSSMVVLDEDDEDVEYNEDMTDL